MVTQVYYPSVGQVESDMSWFVSNSEVAAFTSCERKHYYGHLLNLKPVRYSDSLNRGIIGHEALAAFYQGVMDGESLERCRTFMNDVVTAYLMIAIKNGDSASKEMLLGLVNLLEVYVEFQAEDQWEILAVEKSYHLSINESYGYGMRLDLLVKLTTGPRAGEIAIVDHKFVYDMYTLDALRVNSQMPKYLATVRADTGLVITHGILNMIRHRTKKGPMTYEEKFRREIILPSNTRIRSIMREQFLVSEKIMARRNMPIEQAEQQTSRALNLMTCRNCSFIDLCMDELDGHDVSLSIQENFEENTSYGYNKESADDSGMVPNV
jgi:PD-(D/E)XK nuclease superfamily